MAHGQTFSRSEAKRFAFTGMRTVSPPDVMPPGKYPLAINIRAYLQEAITSRLSQSNNLLTASLPGLVHSLRQMTDTTPAATAPIVTGPNGCGTGTDQSAGTGTIPWQNPGNITASDGNYASVALTASGGSTLSNTNLPSTANSIAPGAAWLNTNNIFVQDGVYSQVLLIAPPPEGITLSQWLQATGYNFNIPAAAGIKGVLVTVYRTCSRPAAVTDQGVTLLKAGAAVGSDHSNAAFWPTTSSIQTYGSSTDLWGTTGLTPADINNAGFGFQIKVGNESTGACSASIDAIAITVYYVTPPTSGTSDFLNGTNFGFALPNTEAVAGIFVEVQGNASLFNLGLFTIQLLKAGTPVGTPKTFKLPLTNGFVSLGSQIDLWGTTWLFSDINNAQFGVQLQVATTGSLNNFFVDFVRITVYGFTIGQTGPGSVFISGVGTSAYINNTQVATGFSGKRLSLLPFRPNTSVAPWMYVGDSAQMVKIRSDGTTYKVGIKEPQAIPTVATSGAGPITGNIFYAYQYRSSKTGAVSNSSPTSTNGFTVASSNAMSVICTASTDPQVDLIDVYRFGGALLNYTYVTTILNSSPSFTDNIADSALAANPIMSLSNFEPFPSIDVPRQGVLTISAGPVSGTYTATYVSGDTFNLRWLGGTIVNLSSGATPATSVVLVLRPSSSTNMVLFAQPLGSLTNGNYNFTISQPILAAQPLPALWGPTDGAAYVFGCGDPLRPGTVYFTAGNNPDAAPQTNSIDLTSPAEPLIGGCIVNGLSLVFSAEHAWLCYPSFAQATASIVGILGQPFNPVMTISDRGLVTKEGICTDGGGTVFFIAKDSIRASVGGIGSFSITDDDIYNLFPHEGQTQQPYSISGFTIQPPDYSQPDGMVLRFSQGYLYFDYIGLDGNRWTLTYDTSHSQFGNASNNYQSNNCWVNDQYTPTVSIHADNPGMFISPGPDVPIGPLTGCVDGTIRQLISTGSESQFGAFLTPCDDAGDQRATKQYGDIYMETTTTMSGVVQMAIWQDRYSNNPIGSMLPSVIPAVAGVRVGSVLELNAGAGLYARDIELEIVFPLSIGTILHLWQPSTIPQPETTGQRFTDWFDMGTPLDKFFQGVIIEADTSGQGKLFACQTEGLVTIPFAEMPAGGAIFSGQSRKAFSFVNPFFAHQVRLVPLDTIPWRLFSLEWISKPFPELCQEWHTEALSFGLMGYGHFYDINIAHISTAPITLTLIPDFGPQQVITIAASGGAQSKVLVKPPAFKFKLCSWNFTSTQPFRLWREDIECKLGQWGRQDSYTVIKPFGGPSSDGAEV